MTRHGARGRAVLALAAWALLAAGPARGELDEPGAAPGAEAPVGFADYDVLRSLLARLWLRSDLAPERPARLSLVDGLGVNAVSASRTISVSKGYVAWTRRFSAAERERVLARTLAHELAHIALGHGIVASPQAELEAEALGIYYFELAGFDCRWWVEYVRGAEETAGRRGWPALSQVVEHDAETCARVRAFLGRDTPEAARR